MTTSSIQLLDEKGLSAALDILVDSLAETYQGRSFALVGLLSRGDMIARRLKNALEEKGIQAQLGYVDISLYRDDLGKGGHPLLRSSYLPFSVDDAEIVLVDDVLFTGRTIRAALNVVMDYGRPQSVRLAVLIDRGGREMPIQPDFVGYISPKPGAEVSVLLSEVDHRDEVVLV